MDPVFALRTGVWCVNDKSVEVARFLEKLIRPRHRWLVRAWSRAAFSLRQKKRYDEASACYVKVMKAISIKGRSGTSGHARVYALLGYVHHLMGSLDEAASLYESSLAIYLKRLGKNHDILVAVLHNLSMILSQEGALERADLLNRRALGIIGQAPTEVPNFDLGGGICTFDLEPVKTYPSWKGRSFTEASLYSQRARILRHMGCLDEAEDWERHCDALSMRTMAEW